MRSPDPYRVFRFIVEIDGLITAGFSEATGLQADSEVEDVIEGGVNHFVHKVVRVTKYPNVVLKRGLTDMRDLSLWHQEIVEGRVARRTIRVILQDSLGTQKWSWVVSDAYPVKWSVSDLNASGNSIAIESVEFAHHGLTRSPR